MNSHQLFHWLVRLIKSVNNLFHTFQFIGYELYFSVPQLVAQEHPIGMFLLGELM